MPLTTQWGFATESLLIQPMRSVSMSAPFPWGGDTLPANICSSRLSQVTCTICRTTASLTPWATSSLFAMSMGTTSTVLHVCSSSWWTCKRKKTPSVKERKAPPGLLFVFTRNSLILNQCAFYPLDSTIAKIIFAGTVFPKCWVAAPWQPVGRRPNYLWVNMVPCGIKFKSQSLNAAHDMTALHNEGNALKVRTVLFILTSDL